MQGNAGEKLVSEPKKCPDCPSKGKITRLVATGPFKEQFQGNFTGESCYRIFNDANGRAQDLDRYDYCRENNDLLGSGKASLQRASPRLGRIVRD